MDSSYALKFLAVVGLAATVIYMLVVYFELDRRLSASNAPIASLASAYASKPLASAVAPVGTRRVALLLECSSAAMGGSSCESTVRSLLDQSVRVDDIAVEEERSVVGGATTTSGDQLSADVVDSLRGIVTTHAVGTSPVRDVDASTVVLRVANDTFYPYGYVEKTLRHMSI